MKTIAWFILFFSAVSLLSAQSSLPPALQNAIPSNYDIVSGQYVNYDFVTAVNIHVSLPGDNACDNGLEQPVNIEIEIMEMKNNDVVQMQEEQIPFVQLLPTRESIQPEINQEGLIGYGETQLIDIDAGRMAYYTYTIQCIMSQHESFEGVHLIALQGSHARKLSVVIDGPISDNKAVEIAKSLINTFSAINLSVTE